MCFRAFHVRPYCTRVSRDDPESGRRGHRDALGQLGRYRLTGPLDHAPGELHSPLFRGRSLAIGARYLIWPIPEEIDLDTALERARAIDALSDPAFPSLIDFGELPVVGLGAGAPRSFLAFQGEAGQVLRQRLASSALDLADAILMARRTAKALDRLHSAGLMHGSLTPATVFLTVQGEVRLLLANLGDPTRYRERTDARDRLGWAAAAYLAPEQLPRDLRPVGMREPEVGASCDLWALGALFHESLTGDPPFHGRSFDAQSRSIANRDPKPIGASPGSMPIELERFHQRSLAKERDSRYPDARSVVDELEGLAAALEPGDLRPPAGTVARGLQPPPAPTLPSAGVGRHGVQEAPLGGALGWMEERRQRLEAEPGPAWWQLLLPPLVLAALILLVAWILWRS